jgi:hypothetical protein
MSFWSRVKGRKAARQDAERSVGEVSSSCGAGLSRQAEARLSLANFLAEVRLEDGCGTQAEDTSSLTSWSSLVKQRSRLSKSVKVFEIKNLYC